MRSNAETIVNWLLETAFPQTPAPASPWSRRVTVQKPDGSTAPADWCGYYALGGGRLQHSIALRHIDGKWSHGLLPPGHRILTELPAYADWKFEQEARERQQAKVAER